MTMPHFFSVFQFLLQLSVHYGCSQIVLNSQTWSLGHLELLSLLLVCDDQGVQVSAAMHLVLNIVLVLDLHGFSILPLGCQQETFHFFNLARHVTEPQSAREGMKRAMPLN